MGHGVTGAAKRDGEAQEIILGTATFLFPESRP